MFMDECFMMKSQNINSERSVTIVWGKRIMMARMQIPPRSIELVNCGATISHGKA